MWEFLLNSWTYFATNVLTQPLFDWFHRVIRLSLVTEALLRMFCRFSERQLVILF